MFSFSNAMLEDTVVLSVLKSRVADGLKSGMSLFIQFMQFVMMFNLDLFKTTVFLLCLII